MSAIILKWDPSKSKKAKGEAEFKAAYLQALRLFRDEDYINEAIIKIRKDREVQALKFDRIHHPPTS